MLWKTDELRKKICLKWLSQEDGYINVNFTLYFYVCREHFRNKEHKEKRWLSVGHTVLTHEPSRLQVMMCGGGRALGMEEHLVPRWSRDGPSGQELWLKLLDAAVEFIRPLSQYVVFGNLSHSAWSTWVLWGWHETTQTKVLYTCLPPRGSRGAAFSSYRDLQSDLRAQQSWLYCLPRYGRLLPFQ